MANRTKRTRKKEEKFLEALAASGVVGNAASIAGVGRRTVYEWREADPVFAKSWDAAVEEAVDLLEEEARRRAVIGTERPVFYRGDRCGIVREYSDSLLIFLLKANRPAKYREHSSLEVTGSEGQSLIGELASVLDKVYGKAQS